MVQMDGMEAIILLGVREILRVKQGRNNWTIIIKELNWNVKAATDQQVITTKDLKIDESSRTFRKIY